MKFRLPSLAAVVMAVMVCAGSPAHAKSTKDIVRDLIEEPAPTTGSTAALGDAMAVSVLLEAPDGSLTPKGTDTLFHTGDRFRVRLLISRNARVAFYNTNPKGQTNPAPLWQGEVKAGQETISPRLALTGTAGIDRLHIVLAPAPEPSIFAWLGRWLRLTKEGEAQGKDVHVEVQNTPSTTYLLNAQGEGLVSTVSIVHRAP